MKPCILKLILVLSSLMLFWQQTCFCFSPFSSSDKTDSLEVALVLANDEAKVPILISLSELYQKKAPSVAFEKASLSLEISERLKSQELIALSLKNLGNLNKFILSDYDQALKYAFQALRVTEKMANLSMKAEVYFLIGEIYEDANDNFKALENYMQALTIQEGGNETERAIKSLHKLGTIQARLSNYKKALEYHQIAIDRSRDHQKVVLEAISLYHIAEVQQLNSNIEEALKLYIEALKVFRQHRVSQFEGHSLNKIGTVYKIKKEHERALENFKVALNIHLANEDWPGVSESHNYMGQIFMEEKNYGQALVHFNHGLRHAERVSSKKLLHSCYENLYTCYLALQDFEKVVLYKNFYISISELIVKEENSRELSEMQVLFEIEKKENEINALQKDKAIQKLELEKERKNKFFFIVLSCLILIISLLLFHLYKNNRRNNIILKATNEKINLQNIELQELNATKDKFFGIVSHDLKGPLNALTSFSGLLLNHSGSLKKEEIQMLAKDLDKSLKVLFAFLENLLEWARSQTGSIEHQPAPLKLKELVYETFTLLKKSAQNKEISLLENVSPELHIIADKNQMHTVFRNLVSNAIKFTNQGGTVYIEARNENNNVLIEIRDNGVGIKKNILEKLFKLDHKHTSKGTANEKGTGLGLILCNEFITKNGGQIMVESTEGTGTTISFKIPKAESMVAI